MRKKYGKRTLWKSFRWMLLCFALVTVLFVAFPMEASADSLASVKYLGTTVVTDIAATQDGKLLYVTESSSSPIYIMNADGSSQTTLGSQTFMQPKYLFVTTAIIFLFWISSRQAGIVRGSQNLTVRETWFGNPITLMWQGCLWWTWRHAIMMCISSIQAIKF